MKWGNFLFSSKRHANGQQRPRKSDSFQETSYQAFPPTLLAAKVGGFHQIHNSQPHITWTPSGCQSLNQIIWGSTAFLFLAMNWMKKNFPTVHVKRRKKGIFSNFRGGPNNNLIYLHLNYILLNLIIIWYTCTWLTSHCGIFFRDNTFQNFDYLKTSILKDLFNIWSFEIPIF